MIQTYKQRSLKKAILLLRNIPYFAIFAMCISVFWVGWSWIALGMAIALYFLRMFAITGFYHRYFSHKTFKTSRAFQFIMSFWGMTSAQKGPMWWAAHHRHHHAHSDTPEDVHSPHQHSFLWAHMFWVTTYKNSLIKKELIPDLLKCKELKILEYLDVLPPILLGCALFLFGYILETFAPHLGTNAFQMLIWGFFISTVLLYHGTYAINSLTHLLGRRRYDTKDHSRNSFILALITMGEGWHNNHHYYKGSARQGFFWWEIDITYYGLKVLSWMRLIHDLQPVPVRVKIQGRRKRAK